MSQLRDTMKKESINGDSKNTFLEEDSGQFVPYYKLDSDEDAGSKNVALLNKIRQKRVGDSNLKIKKILKEDDMK